MAQQPWPAYDEAKCKDDTVEIVVQVGGKVRARLTVAADISKEDALAAAKADAEGGCGNRRQEHCQGDLRPRQAGQHCGPVKAGIVVKQGLLPTGGSPFCRPKKAGFIIS